MDASLLSRLVFKTGAAIVNEAQQRALAMGVQFRNIWEGINCKLSIASLYSLCHLECFWFRDFYVAQ